MTEKEFITLQTQKIWETLLNFPDDFIKGKNFKEISLPNETLVLGEEFFGTIEITTIYGKSVYQAATFTEAKFILYANKKKPEKLLIPESSEDLKSSVTEYEHYLDALIKNIEYDYKKTFIITKNSINTVNQIFKLLNLKRY